MSKKTISELVDNIFNDFQVGDKVKFHGKKGEIWSIADEEDCYGQKYAITYIVEGEKFHTVTHARHLKPIKSKHELEKGDKFKNVHEDSVLTVKDRHEEPDGQIWYFYVNEGGYCDMCQPEDIREIL